MLPGRDKCRGLFLWAYGAGALSGPAGGFAGSGVPRISDSDSALALQAFTGINYRVSDTTHLHLGLKYLWIGEATLVGVKEDVGDDLAVMAGVSFKF